MTNQRVNATTAMEEETQPLAADDVGVGGTKINDSVNHSDDPMFDPLALDDSNLSVNPINNTTLSTDLECSAILLNEHQDGQSSSIVEEKFVNDEITIVNIDTLKTSYSDNNIVSTVINDVDNNDNNMISNCRENDDKYVNEEDKDDDDHRDYEDIYDDVNDDNGGDADDNNDDDYDADNDVENDINNDDNDVDIEQYKNIIIKTNNNNSTVCENAELQILEHETGSTISTTTNTTDSAIISRDGLPLSSKKDNNLQNIIDSDAEPDEIYEQSLLFEEGNDEYCVRSNGSDSGLGSEPNIILDAVKLPIICKCFII